MDTTVRLVKRQSLEMVAESDAMVARNLLSMTTNNFQHAEDHMLLLGRKTSLERVAAFLLEMDKRLTAAGVMALPMSRRDIADYLGLTLETVSRALSRLHEPASSSFIGNTQRQIVLWIGSNSRSSTCRLEPAIARVAQTAHHSGPGRCYRDGMSNEVAFRIAVIAFGALPVALTAMILFLG